VSDSGQTGQLESLLRWQEAGGTWEVLTRSESSVTVALCRCDGGEVVDRVELSEPDAVAYVARSRD